MGMLAPQSWNDRTFICVDASVAEMWTDVSYKQIKLANLFNTAVGCNAHGFLCNIFGSNLVQEDNLSAQNSV